MVRDVGAVARQDVVAIDRAANVAPTTSKRREASTASSNVVATFCSRWY